MPTGEPSGEEIRSIGGPALIRLLRPRQWPKNLLVFAAAIFADELFVAASASRAALAFVAFCLASSSVYVINDLMDAEVDRRHPVKRSRPIAAGEIGTRSAIWLAVALALAALGLAAAINAPFAITIAVYIALVHFYSIVGKHIVILDVMLVATGFVLRAVGGALAIQVPSSDWFVLCTFFAALFLALSKRQAEMISQDGGAAGHRAVIGEYNEAALNTFTTTAIAATAITYSLPAPSEVTLTIHDVSGRLVRTLESGRLPAGAHRHDWDARDGSGRVVPAGVYFSRLTANGETRSEKIVRLTR